MSDVCGEPEADALASEEQALASYLGSQVIGRASGEAHSECLRTYPRDRYFIGNLRSAGGLVADEREPGFSQAGMSELVNKLAPVAFGAEFRVRLQESHFAVQVKLRWACYYRVFPTYEQQLEHQRGRVPLAGSTAEQERGNEPLTLGNDEQSPRPDDEDGVEGVEVEAALSPSDRRARREPQDTLFIRYRKILCSTIGRVCVQQSQDGNWHCDLTRLEAATETEWARVQHRIQQDEGRLRTRGMQDTRIQVPESALRSPTTYAAFCHSLTHEILHDWRWRIDASVRSQDKTAGSHDWVLSMAFTNATPMPDTSPNVEPFLFEPRAHFTFEDCEVLPFEVQLAPRGFRYDRNIDARGLNCGVEHVGQNGPVEYVTTNTPRYDQMRYITQPQPEARFRDLAARPIETLNKVLEAMTSYLGVWDEWQVYFEGTEGWCGEHAEEFASARHLFESEIDRFRMGIETIASNADANTAFRLTNETFARTGREAWRLFQLVFLASQVPSIVALVCDESPAIPERQIVDVIYFPTGGGKTEAYLGTIVFHCFFDRLRGKKAGVTAWTRFPLRLLTLQQTQRSAEIVGLAELVRRTRVNEPRLTGEDVAGFAVGYFVGKDATPNEIVAPRSNESPSPEWSIANDAEARQRWKRVYRCPACRTNTIFVDFEEETSRLIHRCSNPHCEFPDGRLPVYVVDMEIYRYLPSLIVGTIDKLAGIGNQRKLSSVLGRVDGTCPVHGYYTGDRCAQKDCTERNRLVPGTPDGLSGPTLFVQDELHLLKEGLGTFDAHYETFVQRLMAEFGARQPSKIIASSATIEAFDRQVEHLYGRPPGQARVFPGMGPALGESFYGTTLSYPQRVFLGIIPHNKTLFNAILELVQYYHETLQDLVRLSPGSANPWQGSTQPGTDDWTLLLDPYSTSLTYFRKTLDLHSAKTDLQNAVNVDLQEMGYRDLVIAELTGSTTTDEVARILQQLETDRPAPGSAPDAVLATSMVSHGVDIDRLNTMIFYGMPLQVAEYIQASSRIGRAHVGLILVCLHPARERDQSHYQYFTKFHEFLGQLVEPVAINRWSRFSADRTLPGLFMATLLQLIANRSQSDSPGRYTRTDHVRGRIQRGDLSAEDFIPILEDAYLVNEVDNPGASAFKEDIVARVGNFMDQILAAGPQAAWVSEALNPSPMQSLREVDEQLPIILDENGDRWASRR